MPEVILVVDDEPVLREMISLVLHDEGFAVYVAANGAEALTRHEEQPAALIISDIVMPVLDGNSLVQRLRERGDQTPVVLVSASRPMVLRWPHVQFVAKPFDLEHLLTLVQRMLIDDRQES